MLLSPTASQAHCTELPTTLLQDNGMEGVDEVASAVMTPCMKDEE
jgi:hypothetical protein